MSVCMFVKELCLIIESMVVMIEVFIVGFGVDCMLIVGVGVVVFGLFDI